MTNSVLSYLENAAMKHPDKIAVAFREETYTYEQLRQTAQHLGYVISETGISNKPVAVFADRSVDTIAYFFATLYSGNYYVPIDPNMPIDKIASIFEDAEFSVVLGPEYGKTIANACQNQLNQDCVFAARAMLRYASDNKLFGDAKTVAVRLGKNDPMPTTDFLETIITDCQYLLDEECTGLKMIRISDERLDEDSRLNLDCAKILASYYLGAPTSELSGGEVPLDGVYTITTADGKSCTVDAFNGLVVGK